MRGRRVLLTAALLAGAITGGAALLQWFWAGWSVYAGVGPPVAMRWLLTGAVGAALLLPPGAAMAGAAIGRRLADSGLREQLRGTPAGLRRMAWRAGAGAVAPALLSAALSGTAWMLVLHFDRSGDGAAASAAELPGPQAILAAHALAALIAAAFGLWGAALAVGRGAARKQGRGEWRRTGLWSLAALLVLGAGPALVGPLLPHLERPERALDAVLLLNPVTAVGAALGMDVLRTPRLYMLTRAPEYWYTYPPAAAVAAVYMAAALGGAVSLRRGLERE